MKLNSKLGWGLAWTGLAVVVAVPSVDFLTGHLGGEGNRAAVLTSTTEPVTPVLPSAPATTEPETTASVTTRVTPNGVTIIPAGTPTSKVDDPVARRLNSGKPLPDYISDGDSDTAASPAAESTTTTEVAAIDPAPELVAPTPFPSWARPRSVSRPMVPDATDAPVIVDETELAQREGTVGTPGGPVPPAAIGEDGDWDAARLRVYLENRGLIDDRSADGRSSASVTIVKRPPPSNYDPDGFYLSDGPNNDRAERRARIEELFGEDDDDYYYDDEESSFSLF